MAKPHLVQLPLIWLMMAACCVSACAQSSKSFHQKVGWTAEFFFDDAKVIALCKAIEANDLKEMDRLIKDGADVDAKGKGNMTPLLWAFPDNKPERFKLLLENGADPNVFIESDLNVPRSVFLPGDSVTHLTAKSVFPEHFELVLNHGGDINLVNPRTKDCLLTLVIQQAKSKTKERVKMLVERGVDVNNMSNSTPPIIAAASWFGQYKLATMLLEAGADPSLRIEDRTTKLTHVLVAKRDRMVEHKYGSPKQWEDFNELVELLKKRGASLDEADADIKRWQSWASKPEDLKKQLMDAEIAERKAREAAEKVKKEAAGDGKEP
jgi:ankyrin repeat protein